MKKKIALVLCLATMISASFGCTKNNDKEPKQTAESVVSSPSATSDSTTTPTATPEPENTSDVVITPEETSEPVQPPVTSEFEKVEYVVQKGWNSLIDNDIDAMLEYTDIALMLSAENGKMLEGDELKTACENLLKSEFIDINDELQDYKGKAIEIKNIELCDDKDATVWKVLEEFEELNIDIQNVYNFEIALEDEPEATFYVVEYNGKTVFAFCISITTSVIEEFENIEYEPSLDYGEDFE